MKFLDHHLIAVRRLVEQVAVDRRLGGIQYPDGQQVLAGSQRLGRIEAEGCLGAFMATEMLPVEPDVAQVVHGMEMQQGALARGMWALRSKGAPVPDDTMRAGKGVLERARDGGLPYLDAGIARPPVFVAALILGVERDVPLAGE